MQCRKHVLFFSSFWFTLHDWAVQSCVIFTPLSLFQACLRRWPFCVRKLHLQPLLWLQRSGLLPLWRQDQWHHMFVHWKPHSPRPRPGMPRSSAQSLAGRLSSHLLFWLWVALCQMRDANCFMVLYVEIWTCIWHRSSWTSFCVGTV